MRKRWLPAILMTLIAFNVSAVDTNDLFNFGIAGTVKADNGGFFYGAESFFNVTSDFFDVNCVLDFVNDGKWAPSEGWMKNGFYFNLLDGSIKLKGNPFFFEGGFVPARHRYSQNPYEILIDGSGKPAVGMAFAYEGDFFSYESRWIGLNYLSPFKYEYGNVSSDLNPGTSDVTWKDRGFNHKIYMLHFGKLRLAYEESSVYLNRVFDVNSFLNPSPTILVNTLWSDQNDVNNPWVLNTNDSSMMGFYGDYTTEEFRAEAEFILKDVNASFAYPTNMNKFAWSAGITWKSPIGNLSFWHGGALKYMFEPPSQITGNPNEHPYEYTYYPVDTVNGRTIALSDNYIGFPYGENSLAFRLTWANPITVDPLRIKTEACLDWVLSGSKSPHNPWHEYTSPTEIPTASRTELFTGDSDLEHQLRLSIKAETDYAGFFAKLELGAGIIFNPLALTSTPDMVAANEPAIWKPMAGTIRNSSFVVFTIGYKLSLDKQSVSKQQDDQLEKPSGY